MTNEKVIALTEAAQAHIRKVMEQHANAIGFRLTLKTTGCSGYMYVPEVIAQAQADDIRVDIADDLVVFIAADNLQLLQGTIVDFIDKQLGLQQLVFHNPNAASECGCGESFTAERDDNE